MRHPARLLGIGCNLFSAIGLRLADLRHPTRKISREHTLLRRTRPRSRFETRRSTSCSPILSSSMLPIRQRTCRRHGGSYAVEG